MDKLSPEDAARLKHFEEMMALSRMTPEDGAKLGQGVAIIASGWLEEGQSVALVRAKLTAAGINFTEFDLHQAQFAVATLRKDGPTICELGRRGYSPDEIQAILRERAEHGHEE